MNERERAEIERHVAGLDDLCSQSPANADGYEAITLLALTKMMLTLPSVQQNEAAAEAAGEAYQAALDDVPHWAAKSAIRRWYRGDCGLNEAGRPYDYRWRPAPADLRRIALAEKWRVKSRAETLRRLLAAEPLVEFDPADRLALVKEIIARNMEVAAEAHSF